MKTVVRQAKPIICCIALFALSACGTGSFDGFNSWYGEAAYNNYSEAEMEAVKEEIARLREQQQRYADIQTVPTQQVYQQQQVERQQEVIRYRPDDSSGVNGQTISNGPLFPAMVNRSPSVAAAYQTAQARQQASPTLWKGIWPTSANQ